VTGIIFKSRYENGISLTNPATQDPATITKTGYVTNLTTTNKGDALYGAGNAAWSLTNFGTIKATGSLAHGVKLTAGGTISNHGLIENASGPNSPFHYQNAAITIQGDAGTIINVGTIRNTGSYGAISLQSGGSISNQAHALIAGASNGVKLGEGGSVTNHGVISGAAQGIYLGATSANSQIVNFGTIEGQVGLYAVHANAGNNTLINAGRIVGTGGTAVQFGAGNNVLTVDRGAVFKGAVIGGSGTNEVIEGAAGTLDVNGFSGFETIVLAKGGKDSLTLTQDNFTGVSGNAITVMDGNKGDTVTANGLAAADILVVHAGAGPDVLTGGAEEDVFYAGRETTMAGGTGTNEFIFTAAGKNVIKDFTVSSTNELVFSDAGFDLGLSGATSTPEQLTPGEATVLFVADKHGTFTDASQRLAYDTTTGQLFASSDGSGGTKHLVATLSDHATINASQLFFIT
jgi:hypothetical protein